MSSDSPGRNQRMLRGVLKSLRCADFWIFGQSWGYLTVAYIFGHVASVYVVGSHMLPTENSTTEKDGWIIPRGWGGSTSEKNRNAVLPDLAEKWSSEKGDWEKWQEGETRGRLHQLIGTKGRWPMYESLSPSSWKSTHGFNLAFPCYNCHLQYSRHKDRCKCMNLYVLIHMSSGLIECSYTYVKTDLNDMKVLLWGLVYMHIKRKIFF